MLLLEKFIGYSENPSGYKIFDVTNNKIILSRNVEFFELNPGNSYPTLCHPDISNFIPHNEIWGSNSYYNNNTYTSLINNNFGNTNSNNLIKIINDNKGNQSKLNKNQINGSNNSIMNNTNIINDNNNDKDNNITYNKNTNDNNNKNINSTEIIQSVNNTSSINQNTYNDINITSPKNYNHKRIFINNVSENEKYKKQKLSNDLREPFNYDDIYNLKDKEEWLISINEELENMKMLKVFKPIEKVPEGANIITSRWVFKYKKNSKGEITKRKSRLVARGYTQQEGIDYHETFSPTLKLDSIRIFTALAVQNNFDIQQIDINAAYLNAKLKEEVYMRPPKGHPDYRKRYWKLNKAIYGLKQSGKEWNEELNKYLLIIGFKRLISEPCLYFKVDKKKKLSCILAIYVDDILLAGNRIIVERTKELIKNKFKIKDIGNVNFIIGIKFIKHKAGYFINQTRYIKEIIEKFEMNNATPTKNLIPSENEELRKIKVDQTKYRSAIGNLLYLSICTRPDIIYPISKAAQKSKDPNLEDWQNVLKIIKYLKGTIKYGINFSRNPNISVFTDADYAGDIETRRSTTGFVILIGNSPTSWCSKLQRCISTSIAESEYYSLSECCKHCMWYMNLLNELKYKIKNIEINIDNKAAIYNAKNQSINPKTKHMDIRVHYIRELIKDEKIKLKYVKSQYNLADGFTKYLNNTAMDKFRNSLLIKIDNLNY